MTHSDEIQRVVRMHAAFLAGDLSELKRAAGVDWGIPNGPMPLAIGPCLVYALYHSPIEFVRELLELGADPNLDDHDGFPPLIAVLSDPMRSDVLDCVRLLLEFGVDPDQRGFNDCTPLMLAASADRIDLVELLLGAGADRLARTRIDDMETAAEIAERAGLHRMVKRLRSE